jgi:hypothetical protein
MCKEGSLPATFVSGCGSRVALVEDTTGIYLNICEGTRAWKERSGPCGFREGTNLARRASFSLTRAALAVHIDSPHRTICSPPGRVLFAVSFALPVGPCRPRLSPAAERPLSTDLPPPGRTHANHEPLRPGKPPITQTVFHIQHLPSRACTLHLCQRRGYSGVLPFILRPVSPSKTSPILHCTRPA